MQRHLSLLLIFLFHGIFGNCVDLEDYEYVVVGSGPGGGPLAARLAIAGHKVLLIEAGDDEGDTLFETVPAYNYASSEFDQMRWDYFVDHWTNDTQAIRDPKMVWATPSGGEFVGLNPPAGSTRKGIWYPRAGTLGGCGSHNALITIYPDRSDWETIEDITGDRSWSPDNMRKYFERLEDIHYNPPSLKGHGVHGWLGTTLPNMTMIAADNKALTLITAAANAFGARLTRVISSVQQLLQVVNPDINSDDPGRDQRQALFEYPNAVTDAKRSGPRDFVIATANATNADSTRKYHLDVRLTCLVTKIRFGKDVNGKRKAIGVDFLDGKSLYKADPRSNLSGAGIPGSVNATREVIISAGTYNTPQLLKLSGIGPKAELSALQIPVVVDLPGVGTNMQDRYEVGVIGTTESDFEIWNGCTFGNTPDPCFTEWQAGNGTNNGPYADNGLVVAMVKKSTSASADDPPDLIIGGAPLPFKGYYPGYSSDAVSTKKDFTWVVLKGHTRNRAGTVTLRSADPRDTPTIVFRYFEEGTTDGNGPARDLEAVAEGVLFSRELFVNASTLPGAPAFTEILPGPSVSTKEDVMQWVKDVAWGHHASCSCPIGADGDPMAVLDSKFRVRGVSNLRVVDASVFPQIPGFFIVASVYMISEKAADVILQAI